MFEFYIPGKNNLLITSQKNVWWNFVWKAQKNLQMPSPVHPKGQNCKKLYLKKT